jgi:hypothetical protein
MAAAKKDERYDNGCLQPGRRSDAAAKGDDVPL